MAALRKAATTVAIFISGGVVALIGAQLLFQPSPSPASEWPIPPEIFNDSTDIGRAMKICWLHRHGEGFADGWSDCTAVRGKWTAHIEAVHEAERRSSAIQESKDKELVHSVVAR